MADGTLKVGTITTSSGSGTITIGQSGETVSFPTGVNLSGNGITNTPSFAATATHTLTTGVLEKITFDTEIYDTNNAYDATTNFRFTVPSNQAGKYIFYGQFLTSSVVDDGNLVGVYIYKNGSSFLRMYDWSPATNKAVGASVSTVLDLVESDYIEIYGYQDSGTNSTLSNTMFYGYKLLGA
jgi:hypothetical protein